ncbi:collagen alpha-1(I) chain-like [Cervus canadensis]|uniref:collagen alpha-1(I) chain-like n=1 Tax=Cervus canadensis TaxID=1574408 RepID=UPI001CA30D0E|nr:collagen alpha-1(I) chain-like [Cervus canadensis]
MTNSETKRAGTLAEAEATLQVLGLRTQKWKVDRTRDAERGRRQGVEGAPWGTAARSPRSRESVPPPRPRAGLARARVRREWVPGAQSPVSSRPSGSKGNQQFKGHRDTEGEGLGVSALDAGSGGLPRLREPRIAEKPAGARGAGAWYPDGPAPPPAPARVPGAACERRGSVCFADSGARGEGRGAGFGRPPRSRHLSNSVPRSRAVRGALFLFLPLLMLIPRPDCIPLASSPFLASPSLLFGPLRGPSWDSSYPFAASSSLRLCFFRHLPPEKLVPARGPPPGTVVPPFSLGTAECAGPSIVPRSKSAPPSPWRDSEARARPAFSPGDSARRWVARGRPGREGDVALPKSRVSLLQVSPSAPLAEFARDGERGQGRSRRRGGIFGTWGGGVRGNSSRLPPPLGRCFPPYPPLKPPGPRPSLTSWSGFGRRRKEGPWSPPQLSSAALPDWLCVPGAQLQSLQTPSETQGIRSAATQRGVAGWPQIPGLTSRGSLGGGTRTGRPPQPPRGPASRVLRPRLLSAPPPFPSLPAAASLLLRPPTPPATSPRFLIPATSALGGSLRGRRQPRGASRTDAAGAARSRRRLVNGTRTGAGADTAALALRQGPTARIPRPPSGAPEIAVYSAQRSPEDPSRCHLLNDQSDGWSFVLQKLAASIQWVKKRPTGDVGSPDVMCSAGRDLPAGARSA